MLCAVCRRAEASQDHHIIYEPFEIKIGVCGKCHKEIHSEGAPKMPLGSDANIKAIRGIPDEVWKMLKIRSAMQGITMGKLLSKAIALYLEKGESG